MILTGLVVLLLAIEEVTVSIGEVATHAKTTTKTATHAGEVSRQRTLVTRDGGNGFTAWTCWATLQTG
jgi:hypothetical protein